ncbi:MAG: endonuclease [Candidatus Cloacimonetes bacterium]|nr:endonuclease [Candidatus Cloacimonadota bacterium]
MRKIILFLLCLSCSIYCLCDAYSPENNYYLSCSGLNGEDLKSALHQIIAGHKIFPYFGDGEIGSAEIMMEVDQDPENPDNIICFYSGFSYPKSWTDLGNKADYAALGTTHDNSWNREHVWSKSHGFPNMKTDIAYSDVHNLRPEDRSVNSSKGDKDFDWGGFPEPEVADCFTDINSWQPPDRVKGDIARCIFYMATRYEGTDTPYDLEIVDYTNTKDNLYGKLSTLLEWHKLDPPDEYERRRNQIIYTKYQHNRNPFIDHPEYAYAIWGEPLYNPRLTTSQNIIHFDGVQNSDITSFQFNVTAVNQKSDLSLDIEEFSDIFSFNNHSSTLQLPVINNFINQVITINFNPVLIGDIKSNILFSGYDHDIELQAFILPEKGKWLIDQTFDESLGDFTQIVLQGNPRHGWHHSSWDNDNFARARGNHDEFTPRETWLISPRLSSNNAAMFYLNFRTARNDNNSPDQFQTYIASELPVDGIPADAVKLDPVLSEDNYNWKNSTWLILDKFDLPQKDQFYLLFRYFYDGNPNGQETWEIDDIKLYSK